jgi:hypothetical protein
MRTGLIGLAAAGCAILGMAGCGSQAASVQPSTSAATAPTPTADLTAAASAAYLAAATTANDSNTPQIKALCKSPTRIADIKTCWAKSFTTAQKFLTDITAITFPDSMKADVTALISANTKVAQLANTLSQQDDPTADTIDYNAYNAAANDAAAAAGVVRHDLGLPPVPPV